MQNFDLVQSENLFKKQTVKYHTNITSTTQHPALSPQYGERKFTRQRFSTEFKNTLFAKNIYIHLK